KVFRRQRRQAIGMAKQNRISVVVQRTQQPIRACWIARQVIGDRAAPPGAVAEVILDFFRQMTQDEINLLDAVVRQEFDDMLKEGPIDEGQKRHWIALIQGRYSWSLSGSDQNGPHHSFSIFVY